LSELRRCVTSVHHNNIVQLDDIFVPCSKGAQAVLSPVTDDVARQHHCMELYFLFACLSVSE